mmetsp:Transcript_23276/g.48178  ORF Transcript_23276/g.48178 Transcript_23276/m.48178 type:complete len:761 (+) Transcript_23276:74-2356(+)
MVAANEEESSSAPAPVQDEGGVSNMAEEQGAEAIAEDPAAEGGSGDLDDQTGAEADGAGVEEVNDNNNNTNSPEGLSPYFATLLTHEADGAATAAVASASGQSSLSTDAAVSSIVQSRAQMVFLLWNGVDAIISAGRTGNYPLDGVALGPNNLIRESREVEQLREHDNQNPNQQQQQLEQEEQRSQQQLHVEQQIDHAAPALPPRDAVLYLCAVAKHQVALEEAVLRACDGGGGSPNYVASVGASEILAGGSASGNASSGTLVMKQVADIATAVGTAATFCQNRSQITRSGIIPALRHLMDRFGTIPTNEATRDRKTTQFFTLTPFHPEFLQICLLSSHYHYAQTFLQNHPPSQLSLIPTFFPMVDTTTYLRYHYYSGMIHVGCDDWYEALTSFQFCLTIPCQTVSVISVAARKKSLLCHCLILEAEELDGSAFDVFVGTGESGSGKKKKDHLEAKVFEVPGIASPAVKNFMANPSNRVSGGGGGGSGAGGGEGPESTTGGGAETSEQVRGSPASRSIRRNRGAASSSNSDVIEDVNQNSGRSNSKNYNTLGRYHDLVSTYISGNATHYATLMAEMEMLLKFDGNWGLAKRLEGRIAYRAVHQAASVYSVISSNELEKKLQDICSSLGSSGDEMTGRAVEDALMGMASCDWDDPLIADPFSAKIDQLTSMVSFLSEDDSKDSDDDDTDEQWLECDLSKRLDSCIALVERVRGLDINMTTSLKYQQHVYKEKLMKGDNSMRQGQGVADIGHQPMDIGTDWS